MIFKFKLILLSLIFSTFGSFAQESTLLGTQAPDLQFDKILNSKQSAATLTDFSGKAILIDFWATWCAPCIKAFDHLQTLQQAFPNDLQIITVTSEDEKRITQFLTKFKTTLPIALDAEDKIAEVFPHRIIPHSVLIDKAGIVRVIAEPGRITDEVIQQVLNQEEVNIAEKKEQLKFDPGEPLSGTRGVLFQITLTPYQEGIPSMSTSFRNGRIMMTNLGIRSIYEIARKFPIYTRTIVDVADPKKYDWNKENAYCLEIIAPNKTEEEVLQMMTDYLHQNFTLKSKIENRTTKVKILRRITKEELLQKAAPDSKSTYWSSGGGLHMTNKPIAIFAKYLEGELNVPVVDETGLMGSYDLEFPWYNEDVERYKEELKKIGLELIDAERKIEMLILYEE